MNLETERVADANAPTAEERVNRHCRLLDKMLDHLRLSVPVLSDKESSETSDVWRCLAGSNETAQTVARGARRKSR